MMTHSLLTSLEYLYPNFESSHHHRLEVGVRWLLYVAKSLWIGFVLDAHQHLGGRKLWLSRKLSVGRHPTEEELAWQIL
jgi:hypothetical protein